MRERLEARRMGDQSGYTLVEMLVVMSLMIGLLTVVFSILISISTQTRDNLARTRSLDQAQLGLMQIDRQVRSGNVISDPALETVLGSGVPTYYSLRVYTQTDGVFQCVQWRVKYPVGSDLGKLEYRSWRPDWQSVGGVTPWQTVANNVIKPTGPTIVPADRATWPPFFVEATPAELSSAAQTIRVTLRVKDPEQSRISKPATLTSTLTGRNTIYGYQADTCTPIPTP